MTITLRPETEARLRKRAERSGANPGELADILLSSLLVDDPGDMTAEEVAELWAGIRLGDQAVAEGRERPLKSYVAEQRKKHGFSAQWPSDESREATPYAP